MIILIMVMPKMVKVNLDIEDNLHKKVRKRAIDRSISMKAYILELINKGLSVEEAEDPGGDKGSNIVEEDKAIEES